MINASFVDNIEDTRLKYFTLKRIKNIKNKDIARFLNVSEPAVSRYFGYKMNFSKEREEQMFDFINQF